MKTQELKTKLHEAANKMVDSYFGENTLIERLTNTTLKEIIKANITKIDNFLDMFTDCNGEIDVDGLIASYANAINENIQLNIKDYIGNDFIKNLLPNKILIISKNDILNILKNCSSIAPKLTNSNDFIL